MKLLQIGLILALAVSVFGCEGSVSSKTDNSCISIGNDGNNTCLDDNKQTSTSSVQVYVEDANGQLLTSKSLATTVDISLLTVQLPQQQVTYFSSGDALGQYISPYTTMTHLVAQYTKNDAVTTAQNLAYALSLPFGNDDNVMAVLLGRSSVQQLTPTQRQMMQELTTYVTADTCHICSNQELDSTVLRIAEQLSQ